MGETSKKVTAGPVANSKRVKATTAEPAKKAPAKKTATKPKKATEPKKAKEITELQPKGVVQAPEHPSGATKKENVIAKLWRKWLGL